MPDLVDIDTVKAALLIDGTDSDTDLAGVISAASQMVIDYLDGQAADLLALDDDGELTDDSVIPAQVERATIIICGDLFDGQKTVPSRPGGIHPMAESLLYRLTDPPLA